MSGAAPRFRYKREGAEARAWKRIAQHVEECHGIYQNSFGYPYGLCIGIKMESRGKSDLFSDRMRTRLELFDVGYVYYWPTSLTTDDPTRGRATDRITAAWLCYWMAREEGK